MIALSTSCTKSHGGVFRYHDRLWVEDGVCMHSYYDAKPIFKVPFANLYIMWYGGPVQYTYDLETYDPCNTQAIKKLEEQICTNTKQG